MNPIYKKLGKKITGVVKIPGDKSISIRASIISSIFYGDFIFQNFNYCRDTKTTINCMTKISKFSKNNNKYLTINCENSATTMRLLSGYLCGAFAGMDKVIKLTGDKSLSNRPMNRIVLPLSKMGASIKSTNGHAPIIIDLSKCKLHDLKYKSSVSSGQVKSSLELAAYTSGVQLKYKEPSLSRNHTEIMIEYMHELMHHKHNGQFFTYKIPSDISTASFFIANALIYKGSNIKINNLLINETRNGFISYLKKSGANIKLKNKRKLQGEPVADISISFTKMLKSVQIKKNDIPKMIDEIPLIALLLAKAKGVSKIYGLSELKFKESDRYKAIKYILDLLEIKYIAKNNNLVIYGNPNIDYKIKSQLSKTQAAAIKYLKNTKDHRILLINKILNIKSKYNKYINVSL